MLASTRFAATLRGLRFLLGAFFIFLDLLEPSASTSTCLRFREISGLRVLLNLSFTYPGNVRKPPLSSDAGLGDALFECGGDRCTTAAATVVIGARAQGVAK